MPDFAIDVRDLVKTFRRRGNPEIRAVDGLSFEVRAGQIFGLLGPNGAGKTTTLRMLTTLVAPTGGSARVMGFDVAREGLDVRRRIAVVIQESAAELFLSVRDYRCRRAGARRRRGAGIRCVHDRLVLVRATRVAAAGMSGRVLGC